MSEWLINNLGTIIAVLALAVIVVLIVRKIVKDKKAGRSNCGCGCAGCAMRGSCHKS